MGLSLGKYFNIAEIQYSNPWSGPKYCYLLSKSILCKVFYHKWEKANANGFIFACICLKQLEVQSDDEEEQENRSRRREEKLDEEEMRQKLFCVF